MSHPLPPPSPRTRRVWGVLLTAALLLAFFVNLGTAPLFDRDEGAFSEATREMVASGNYVTTTLNGEPRHDKPILTYYAQLLGVHLLGWNEWGVRIHSAVAALLWVLLTGAFARKQWGEEAGWAAAMLTATSLWVMVIGRAATADALLNLFLALTLFDIYRFWRGNDRRALSRAFLWGGLGFLTKGPVGVVVPAAALSLFAVARGQFRRLLEAARHPLGWLLFLLVTAPWYVAVYLQDGGAFLEGFFLRHNLNRFADTMEGHGGVLYYYVVATLLVLLPHTPLFLRTLGRLRQAAQDDLDLLLWIWFGFVFLFFSFSRTQLPHYILYGATPLFLLMARYRGDLQGRVLPMLPALALASFLVFLPEVVALARPRADDYTQAILSVAPEVLGGAFRFWTATGALAMVVLVLLPRLAPWQRLMGAGLVTAGVVSLAVVPAWGAVQQGPTKEAALLARAQGWKVVMWRLDMPSFAFYYGNITPLREPLPGEVVFTRITRLSRLEVPTEILFQKGGIVLARALEGSSDPPASTDPPPPPEQGGRAEEGRRGPRDDGP